MTRQDCSSWPQTSYTRQEGRPRTGWSVTEVHLSNHTGPPPTCGTSAIARPERGRENEVGAERMGQINPSRLTLHPR